MRIEFYAKADPLGELSGSEGRSRTQKSVVGQFTPAGVVQNGTPHQLNWLLCGMIKLLFIGTLMMNFGEGESWTVEFSPAFPYQGAFFFRTYQHFSC